MTKGITAVRNTILALIPLSGIGYLLDVQRYLGPPLWREQYFAAFLALILGAVFLCYPTVKDRPSRWQYLDMALSALGLAVGGFLAISYPTASISPPSPFLAGIGAVTLLLLFEATRRTVGLTLVIITLAFILYANLANLMPDPLEGRGIGATRLLMYLYVDANSMIGTPIGIVSTVVLAFIVFGAILSVIGGASFISEFASALTGRFVGGPAKVAVVSSSLMGTISGSAVSNVMLTGSFTIPMMRRTGYSRDFAGGVEAVASTGGALMPPVMGAAAFIMVDFIGVPYREIAAAALIPAILYYLGVFFQVDLEARRENLPSGTGASLRECGHLILRSGWTFLIPFGVLLYLLFASYMQPDLAALYASFTALVLGFLSLKVRPQAVIGMLVESGRVLVALGIICAMAGVVIGATNVSGLGLRISHVILAAGESSAILLPFVVAGASIILGMGMPATVVYVLLATLVAPAVVDLGYDRLATHLFVFYFGLLSLITPPICLAAFSAASISGGSPMRTGFVAMKLGIVAYIVPFVFLFSPSLLMQAETSVVIVTFLAAALGTFFMSAALTGYLLRPTAYWMRAFLFAAGILLFLPQEGTLIVFHWGSGVAGAFLGLVCLGIQSRAMVPIASSSKPIRSDPMRRR